MKDRTIEKLIAAEAKRQRQVTNLIASENYVSADVRRATASVFINKYAEGYEGKRYYGGNKNVDELDRLCKKRAYQLFKISPRRWHINTQPLSGSPANLAVYLALVPFGEKIMALDLAHGGHLTHGHPVSITGKLWRRVTYGVRPKTETLDYAALARLAKKEKPKLIVAGFTAYPRKIDFKKFGQIARSIGAYLMVDMSHLAGLVAGGVHPSPFPYADVVTTTTHKTLRGPRGALIFCRRELAEKIDRAVFPGLQGGPHVNQIAGITVALGEALRPAFKTYAQEVAKNAKILGRELTRLGWRLVSGGTDTHLLLVDTWQNGRGLSGKTASDRLEAAGIIVNKNTIPFDRRPPVDPSGIRLGTAAETTRGRTARDMIELARRIDKSLRSPA